MIVDPPLARPPPTEAQSDLRCRLRTLRRRLGYSQEGLAHVLGVTVSTVNRWEQGHATPSPLAERALRTLEERP